LVVFAYHARVSASPRKQNTPRSWGCCSKGTFLDFVYSILTDPCMCVQVLQDVAIFARTHYRGDISMYEVVIVLFVGII